MLEEFFVELVFKQNLILDISVNNLFQSKTSTLWRFGDDLQYMANERVVTERAKSDRMNIAKGGRELRKEEREWNERNIIN